MPHNICRILLLAVLATAIGCSTTPPPEKRERLKPLSPKKNLKKMVKRKITLSKLKGLLGMRRPHWKLGFQEKAFNTCKNDLATRGCRKLYLSVIHVRLQCRSTTGTVTSVTNQELKPLQNTRLKWRLGRYGGRIRTDTQGFAQLTIVSQSPTRRERLSFQKKKISMGLRAQGARRIIIPSNWCE